MAYMKNPRVLEFLDTVRTHCQKCNVRLFITPNKRVNAEGERCDGYFSPPIHAHWMKGSIRVATGNKRTYQWLLTLVHEYVHMKQWMRDDPIFLHADYLLMEESTEDEVSRVCREFRLPIPAKYIRYERIRYLKKLHRLRVARKI